MKHIDKNTQMIMNQFIIIYRRRGPASAGAQRLGLGADRAAAAETAAEAAPRIAPDEAAPRIDEAKAIEKPAARSLPSEESARLPSGSRSKEVTFTDNLEEEAPERSPVLEALCPSLPLLFVVVDCRRYRLSL